MKNKRLTGIGIFFFVAFAFVALYLGGICTLKSDKYSKSVALQRTQSLEVKIHRGKFYDRNMIPLVESGTSQMLIDEYGNINSEKGKTLPLTTERYSADSRAKHIIGYVNRDGKGVSGMEKAFDSVVSGRDYSRVNVIKSADGRVIGELGIGFEPGEDSADGVKLTIDSHIQKICEDAMAEREIAGAVVVMDTDSFDILAMASMPGFDQGRVGNYIYGHGSELVNRCLSPYNAGSIFKIITMSTACQRGMLRYSYICDGKMQLLENVFACHKSEGHGTLNPKEAFANSCNCAFYTMGLDMGAEAILSTARDFGLGSLLLGDLELEESAGNIPSKSQYLYADYVNYSIGQGEILITPLQAANMACIVASGGLSKAINIAEGIYSSKGALKKSLRKNGTREVVSKETAEIIGEAMREAVISGTGKSLNQSPARIAGKTGTAETGWIEDGIRLEHGWFCGYFPYDDPKYAMAVLVENGGSGSVSAAPLFGEIAEKIIKIYPMG